MRIVTLLCFLGSLCAGCALSRDNDRDSKRCSPDCPPGWCYRAVCQRPDGLLADRAADFARGPDAHAEGRARDAAKDVRPTDLPKTAPPDAAVDRKLTVEATLDGPRSDKTCPCTIGGGCYKGGDFDPTDTDLCRLCLPEVSRIRWSPAPGCVTTLVGPSATGGDLDGPVTAAMLDGPRSVVWDEKRQTLYVSDENNGCVRAIANDQVTPMVGTTCISPGPPTFSLPQGITLDNAGAALYVADKYHSQIRRVDLTTSPGKLTTVATGMDGMEGVAFDASGTLYIGNYEHSCIQKVSGTSVIQAVGICDPCKTDGSVCGFLPGSSAQAKLMQPIGIAIDATGTMYLAQFSDYRIASVGTGGQVEAYAGYGWGYADGQRLSQAKFTGSSGVTVGSNGDLWIAEYWGHRIRRIDTAGNVSTVAGSGNSAVQDGPALTASFIEPVAVAERKLSGGGVILYVADRGKGNAIRLVRP